jgi:hypothetical protein
MGITPVDQKKIRYQAGLITDFVKIKITSFCHYQARAFAVGKPKEEQ